VAEERLRILISDTGLGIMEQDVEKLFKPFERLGATHGTIEGTGLGLALSKRLVEAMDGTMGIESTVGQGSTVWMELPVTEGPVERDERTRDEVRAIEKDQGSGTTCTILYIEDNLSNLRLIERILKKRTRVVLQSAMQGRLGLELALKHRPAMILLDLHLPDMMGDEVLRRLRADPETHDIPVVMISADATAGQVERLRAMGAVDYLTKPLDVKRFIAVLDTVLKAEDI
jgi:CheY-like chemotaxis protein